MTTVNSGKIRPIVVLLDHNAGTNF